jgi:23S rRNA pseudouridine1911/1915/1917 synthase
MNKRYPNILLAGQEDSARRIDQFISDRTGISRSQVQKLIESGNVTISGKPARKKHRVRANEVIEIAPLMKETETLLPQHIELNIVHKDDHVIVIDKPPGLVMYPAAGHPQHTLMNAVAYHCKKLASIGSPLRPGVVHRLDKDTSGLVIIALNDETYYSLQKQFKDRTIEREYLAIVDGRPKKPSGEIDAPIGRAVSDRKKMSTRTRRGKEAKTYYTIQENLIGSTLIEAKLATGRTHQIRVHFASQGHPVLGDRTYGKKTHIKIGNRTLKVPRQMLHAHTLGFIHPATGEKMSFSSLLPEDMKHVLKTLRKS